MEAFNARSKKFGMYADETFLPVGIPKGKLLQRQEKKGAKKEVLVRCCSVGVPVSSVYSGDHDSYMCLAPVE